MHVGQIINNINLQIHIVYLVFTCFICIDDALTALFKTFPKDMFLSVYLVCSYLPKMQIFFLKQ